MPRSLWYLITGDVWAPTTSVGEDQLDAPSIPVRVASQPGPWLAGLAILLAGMAVTDDLPAQVAAVVDDDPGQRQQIVWAGPYSPPPAPQPGDEVFWLGVDETPVAPVATAWVERWSQPPLAHQDEIVSKPDPDTSGASTAVWGERWSVIWAFQQDEWVAPPAATVVDDDVGVLPVQRWIETWQSPYPLHQDEVYVLQSDDDSGVAPVSGWSESFQPSPLAAHGDEVPVPLVPLNLDDEIGYSPTLQWPEGIGTAQRWWALAPTRDDGNIWVYSPFSPVPVVVVRLVNAAAPQKRSAQG